MNSKNTVYDHEEYSLLGCNAVQFEDNNNSNQHFGEIYRLLLQGKIVSQARNQQQRAASSASAVLLSLLLVPQA
jgi:hypothetical protein